MLTLIAGKCGAGNGVVRRGGSRRRAGFSLLELTLVLVIIGLLIGAAAYSVAGAGARAKVRVTKASMETIRSALSQYNLEHSAFPPTLQTLITTKFLEDKKLRDGWDREFYYDPRGRGREQPYTLASVGEDGQAGTEDDIDIWTMNR